VSSEVFLASSLFRAVLVPVVSVIAIAVSKWAMSRDDAKDDWAEIFAMGPDLLIASLIAIPAFITEKVTVSADASRAAQSLALSGWLFLMVFFLALIGFTYERKIGKGCRRTGGWRKAWLAGVTVPMVIGAGALSLTFELAR
jgi:branched-subunit amino acid permease